MLLPWNTDAPIYHIPFATIGLIVANVIVLVVAIASPEETIRALVLEYEHGLQPIQWVTSLFLHLDVFHILGNMFFLWAFGLVVEGKVGWWKFLLIYLGIGIGQCALEQPLAIAIGQEGASYGASAAIYGLIGVALIWAPQNQLTCFAPLGFHFEEIEIPILAMAGLHVGFQFLGIFLFRAMGGSGLTSEILHLMGFGMGLAVGTIMYNRDWVDCEGWDLFAVLKGREGEEGVRRKKKRKKKKPKPVAIDPAVEEAKIRDVTARMGQLVQDGQFKGAAALYLKMKPELPGWTTTSADLVKLVNGLNQSGDWDSAIPIMVEHLQRFPEQSIRMRLQLAQVLIQFKNRPTQALRVLSKLPAFGLPANLAPARERLEREARAAQEKVGMEIETEDW